MIRRANATDFRGQRVLLVGLGVHGGGIATARWLVRQGAILRVTDQQTVSTLAPSIRKLRDLKLTYHLGINNLTDWKWAQRIVLNPGVSPNIPPVVEAVRRGIPIDNEASIFLREFTGLVIGITGTRGKSTTALLMGEILKLAHRHTIVSGNVRDVPMLKYLPQTTAATWAVLELSSYQLERLPVPGRQLQVAVMTNLFVDHLNRHGSILSYAQTKYNIFRGQNQQQVKVLNWDDQACRRAVDVGQGRVQWYSPSLPIELEGVTVRAGWVVEYNRRKIVRLLPLSWWKLEGQHNLKNVLAAIAGARAMNIKPNIIARAVRSFSGVPYRQQIIRTYQGHRFINDTTATSPDATLAALLVYPRGLYILGGTDKKLDFTALAKKLVKHNIATIFLPGSATVKMQSALRRQFYRRPLVTVQSMSTAVKMAFKLVQPHQDIILSPGAASFGLFIHEFDRGDKFNRFVKLLP